jgi:Alpha amylase, catalytic domain
MEFSIKFIQGRFKTRMATESAIFPESSVVCSIFAISASMRSGCRRFFRRPWPTLGYDISNYLGVDSIFGTLDDFDRLVAAAHARNLKIILDLVPNHTSDQHPWFIESRSSRDNPKRDWYLWREPRADGLPRTTGCRNLVAAPGATTRAPSNTIITPSCDSNLI